MKLLPSRKFIASISTMWNVAFVKESPMDKCKSGFQTPLTDSFDAEIGRRLLRFVDEQSNSKA